MDVIERILDFCKVDYPNIDKATEEEFAMARRRGIGASDTSAIMGLMEPFKTRDQVMENKLSKVYTDEEKAIGTKRNVRAGRMLEPHILEEAQKQLDVPVYKPVDMYRIAEYPWLTINFDGVASAMGDYCPVEAKYISLGGDKYYDFKDMNKLQMVDVNDTISKDKINEIAAWHGIPSYYLVQLHQQMMGMGSLFGKLAVLRDKTWDFYVYHIPRYQCIINTIIEDTWKFWKQIEHLL